MSNKSYVVLNNSTDNLDVTIPVKEPVSSQSSSTTNNSSGDTLQTRYWQIAVAVALYWYEEV
jgi:hypothetical protein